GDLWMLGAEQRAALLERGLQERVGLLEATQLLVDPAERQVEAGLRLGLAVEGARLAQPAIEQAHDAQVLRRSRFLVAALKEIEGELLDALRALGLGDRLVARDRESDREEGDEADDGREDDRRSAERAAVAADELPDPVADALGTGLERLAALVVVDVAD